MARAAVLAVLATVLLAGCGDSGTKAGTPVPTTPAAAPCTKAALLTALRALGTVTPVDDQTLKCGSGYALTRVREGSRTSAVLWQQAAGSWSQIDRKQPGVCPDQAAVEKLCTAAPPDPALRQCTRKAFLVALRDDVERSRFRVTTMRCSGDYATTTFVVSGCANGAARYSCQRTRIAAWKRDKVRWRLITYEAKLDCPIVQAAAPQFPTPLCS